jgi:hypothetical protein
MAFKQFMVFFLGLRRWRKDSHDHISLESYKKGAAIFFERGQFVHSQTSEEWPCVRDWNAGFG